MVRLPFFGTELASYRDRGRFAGTYVEANLPRDGSLRLGGAMAINKGSRATDFYQPQVELRAPVTERIDLMTEWRYYAFGETFLRSSGFRTHTFSAGLRISLR